MKSAVIVFPGSNCDRDMAVALKQATGSAPEMVWHKNATLPDGLDLVTIPGGFSFGDYLRCGAIAAQAPIMREVVRFAESGGTVLGVCNGFQVLIEAGLLPGALMRNSGLRFVCRTVGLTVATRDSIFTQGITDTYLEMPVAHHDGNYIAGPDLLAQLQDEDRIAFRYTDNPNGSVDDIAGVLSPNRRVLGMMPHPERASDAGLGGTDGGRIFDSLAGALAPSV